MGGSVFGGVTREAELQRECAKFPQTSDEDLRLSQSLPCVDFPGGMMNYDMTNQINLDGSTVDQSNQPGTQQGTTQSWEYNAKQREGTLRLAMVQMLQSPPAGFADVVKGHFYLRRK